MTANREFDFSPRTRVVFGVDSIHRIGELASGLSARRPLIVTDTGIVAAGHVGRAQDSLRQVGLNPAVFDGVRENPTTADVDACVSAAREWGADCLIGLGGGSSMDTAKGANFLLTNGGRMHDYWGVGKAIQPMLPLIAVPTTAGTGSECQSFALIADEMTHQKMACGDPKAAARVAILDPRLTLSQPRAVTACTGIDAIAHAIETAVTKRRTPWSMLFSREAYRLMRSAFPRVLEDPDCIEARAGMLLGAAFAGTAIEASMLGAAHSAANPLTAHFNVVHGQAVGMMLPHVIRFNAGDPEAANGYAELAQAAALFGGAEEVAQSVEMCLDAAGMAASPAAFGMSHSDVALLSEEASRQWTAAYNPRAISAADFESLYRATLAP